MTNNFNAQRLDIPQYRNPTVADLTVATISVESHTNNIFVWDLYTKHRELVSLPVIENGRPIGLINRNIFMTQMSKPYHRELYGKKSCIAFMDKSPLIVESEISIEELTFRAIEFGERALADGFIITTGGNLRGVGFGLDLMRVVANLQAEKNQQIMQSIEYASVIQKAMLSRSHEALTITQEDAYLVWQPRDVVGGDFYHFCSYPDGWFAAIADCTGHGVPGAFMTLISSAALVNALQDRGPHDPATVLTDVNRSIKETMNQVDGRINSVKSNDGLDAAIVWFERSTHKLTYAGARIGLLVMDPQKEEFDFIEGERMGIGYLESPINYHWSNKIVPIKSGSLIFLTTDGLVDQIGGPRQISFGKRRIRNSILKNRARTAEQISLALVDEFNVWHEGQRRRDDVTFLCIRT